MFSIFKNKSADLNSIEIPNFGWSISNSDKSIIQWINPEETIAISLNFFDLPPDLPTIDDIETLRKFYRQSISSINGGIIEIDVLKIHSISIVKAILKFPQDPTGITYLASLTIPFQNCSYVVKVQCPEFGITGLRDSVIANKLLAKGEIKIGNYGYENWFSDPYISNYKSKTLMNKSEESLYDKDFPNHPLTNARKVLETIISELKFKPEIFKFKPFIK